MRKSAGRTERGQKAGVRGRQINLHQLSQSRPAAAGSTQEMEKSRLKNADTPMPLMHTEKRMIATVVTFAAIAGAWKSPAGGGDEVRGADLMASG